jgi:hypothetical protein
MKTTLICFREFSFCSLVIDVCILLKVIETDIGSEKR